MLMIVEDGTWRGDANSYVTLEYADRYHLERGNNQWVGGSVQQDSKETALIRGSSFIDLNYRGQFPGYKRNGRAQKLEWPRSNVLVPRYGLDLGDEVLPDNEVPYEVKNAVCEAALRELVKPGSLSPDLKRGGAIQSVGAGSAQVTYFAGAPTTTVFQAIDLALGPMLLPTNEYVGRAVRG